MEYGIILGFWLLFIFFGCAGLYCVFAVPVKARAIQKVEPSNEQIVCDFANEQYREAWKAIQGHYDGTASEYYTAASYLESAVKLGFAMPGKGCTAWWQNMIKTCKPASPSKPNYYEHIPAPKPMWHYDKDFNIIVHWKPDYPTYAGNGFGRLPVNEQILPMANSEWFNNHYAKYPGGILPEQTMVRSRIK